MVEQRVNAFTRRSSILDDDVLLLDSDITYTIAYSDFIAYIQANTLNSYVSTDILSVMNTDIDFNGWRAINLSPGINDTDSANIADINNRIAAITESDIPSIAATYQRLTPLNDVNVNGYKLINVGTPVLGTDGANKDYVDDSITAIDYPVTSVNGKTDAVVLIEGDIPSIASTYLKLLPTADINANSNKIINLAPPTANADATNKLYTDTADNLRLKTDGTNSPTANIPMNNFKLTGLSAGTANGHSLRYDEFSSSPKVRQKIESSFTGLSITVSTNSGTPTQLLTGLANTPPFINSSKITPLNQPTALFVQLTLTGTFTVGVLQSGTILTLAAQAGAVAKPLGKYYLGTTNGALNVYSHFIYEIDVGGNAVTNGITLSAYVDNGTASITGIAMVISQYNI